MQSLAPISIKRPTDSTTELITVAQAKEHLRVVDMTDDDDYITAMITEVRHVIEEATRRACAASQTWQASYECFPSSLRLMIPRPPLATVESVKYYDSDNALQTVSSANYVIDSSGSGCAVLAFKSTFSVPTVSSDYPAPVQVNFTAGYSTLPGGLRRAMLYLLSHYYDNRSPVSMNLGIMPLTFQYALDQYKIPNRL